MFLPVVLGGLTDYVFGSVRSNVKPVEGVDLEQEESHREDHRETS